jgi:hypothetical protein
MISLNSKNKKQRRTTSSSVRGTLAATLVAASLGSAVGCGDRDEFWDATPSSEHIVVGLTRSVAVHDESLNRVLFLSVDDELNLIKSVLPVGENVTDIARSHDGEFLYVLSRGAARRLDPDDEHPSLRVFKAGVEPEQLAIYELSDPLGKIAVDPAGDWIVLYAAEGVVENPNLFFLVPVSTPGAPIVKRSIRSYGGRPLRTTFTDRLVFDDAEHRLLLIETEYDVTIVDLDLPESPEITLRLPDETGISSTSPAQVVFHDGDPATKTDARLAVRLQNSSDIVIAQLDAPDAEASVPFSVVLTIADAGATPSAIDFVQTDDGLQLAALVPARSEAVLVSPATSVVQHVALPAGFSQMTRVTEDLEAPPDLADVALLWGESSRRAVGFWSLGRTSGEPYRSVESLSMGVDIVRVRDVPGSEHDHMKLLESAGGQDFFALDLTAGTSSPLVATSGGFKLEIASDGSRAWAARPGDASLAMIELSELYPRSVYAELPITEIFDIERSDGKRALVALHDSELVSATIFDAKTPDSAGSRFFGQLFLGTQ